MTLRPIRIDDQLRGDHCYLEPGDECYALGEYVPGADFGVGLNDLVQNFKKPMDRKDLPEFRYKLLAIARVSRLIRSCVSAKAVQEATFVPIPPSKAEGDPLYDPRLSLALTDGEPKLQVRELLVMRESVRAHHDYQKGERRPTPADLAAFMYVDAGLCNPPPSKIIIVDDVLTNGTHFKAAQLLLRERFPGVPIIGLFIARRKIVQQDVDFDFLDTVVVR